MFNGKKWTKSTVGSWRGTDPSTDTKIAEITSGRAILQQGLAATCNDPDNILNIQEGVWSDA
ncbi:MAG: hypothetical protein GY941_16940 [Planctomycetes bacterium]|nr:hypothetical protein [Planctomycetota bacterium]